MIVSVVLVLLSGCFIVFVLTRGAKDQLTVKSVTFVNDAGACAQVCAHLRV